MKRILVPSGDQSVDCSSSFVAVSRFRVRPSAETTKRSPSLAAVGASVAAMLLWEEGAFELKDPVERFLERFRAVLRRRARFDFDAELAGLSKLEQASAFLAILELRKANELRLEQTAAFAPIRIFRPDVERSAA